MLLTTIKEIESLDDLRPSPNVNSLFTQLVNEVVAEPNTELDDTTCRNVRRIASAAETEMELYWAQKIAASFRPTKALEGFPYIDNYQELVRREIALIEKSGLKLNDASRVLMVGTGPLPLTGFEFMAQRHVQLDHVDISLSALALCSLVGNRLGIACEHILGDGVSVALANKYDVVVIAALAGETVDHKQAIIDNILPSLKAGGRVLLRSAYGTRALLYPAIRADAFSRVTLLEEYHPNDHIINSVFIYKKEEV